MKYNVEAIVIRKFKFTIEAESEDDACEIGTILNHIADNNLELEFVDEDVDIGSCSLVDDRES